MQFSEIELISGFDFQSPSPLMLDVGAHHGFSCEPFASRGWRVMAFEPEPLNRAAFERNLGKNEKVDCLPYAVSDSPGEDIPFYVSKEHFGIHALQPFHESHQPALTVTTVRLDDVLMKSGIEHVTFLKIDVEGADFPALRGFSVERYRPEIVMLEFMDERSLPTFGYDHHDVAAWMQERDYAAYVSAWAPVTEYAREGKGGQDHRWLECARYPLGREPAWGNLIFVPTDRAGEFEGRLKQYLARQPWENMRSFAARIPGARRIYRLFSKSG